MGNDERQPVVAMEAMGGDGPLNVDIPLAMEPTDDDDDIDAELHLHDDMAMPMEQDHLKRGADVLEQDTTEVDDEEPQSKRPRAAMVQQLMSIMERPRARRALEELETEIFQNPKNRRQRRSRDQIAAKTHVGKYILRLAWLEQQKGLA
jgi:hypothetical protein